MARMPTPALYSGSEALALFHPCSPGLPLAPSVAYKLFQTISLSLLLIPHAHDVNEGKSLTPFIS